jgi:glycosyltransferase involved in cell wall biosynthesis
MTADTLPDPIHAHDTLGTVADAIWAQLAPAHIHAARPDFRFDPAFYAAAFPDLAMAGLDVAAHYNDHGRNEGRPGTAYAKMRLSLPDLDARLTGLVVDPALRDALSAGYPDIPELIFEAILLGDPIDRRISDFSEQYYLNRYPDLRSAGMSPWLHYIQHGLPEKRASLGDLRKNLFPGQRPYDPAKPCILIALHEFSKTGAPIVGLDLARSASATHNVVVTALRGGPLQDAVLDHATCVIIAPTPASDLPFFSHPALARIEWAILNSVETFLFSPYLIERGIPWASYLHEYTEYTRPYFKCVFTALYADLLVFSSEQVRTSWADLMTDIDFDIARDSIVLPQYPFRPGIPTTDSHAAARARVANLTGLDLAGRKLVVGAGHVHWRKGTDLFVLTAQIARASGEDTAFVWVGDGRSHEDVQFGTWLEKHMRAAGANQPGSTLHFLPAGPYYKDVLCAADVFFLSSRLDPLPNVIFDAAEAGCQIVMFEQGSGFDDPAYRSEASLHPVEYGNVAAAATRIAELPLKQGITPPKTSLLGRLRKKSTAPAPAAPDVLTPILAALEARLKAQRHFVAGGGAYDLPFLFDNAPVHKSARRAERDKMWTYGRPHIWPSRKAVETVLQASDHWVHKRLRVDRFAYTGETRLPPYAVHIHAHYIDDLGGDLLYYRALRQASRIVITTDTADKAEKITRIGQDCGLRPEVIRMPNTGRDILPFMRLFSQGHAGRDQNEIWCHIHQKKSIETSAAGDVWKRFLLQILLGDKHALSDAITRINQPGIGLVAPMDPYRFGWLENRKMAQRLTERFPKTLPEHPELFPIGNMFWTRARVVQRMNTIFGPDYPWPNEPLPNDGTEFHLIERLWPTVTAMEDLDSLFLEKSDQPRG